MENKNNMLLKELESTKRDIEGWYEKLEKDKIEFASTINIPRKSVKNKNDKKMFSRVLSTLGF